MNVSRDTSSVNSFHGIKLDLHYRVQGIANYQVDIARRWTILILQHFHLTDALHHVSQAIIHTTISVSFNQDRFSFKHLVTKWIVHLSIVDKVSQRPPQWAQRRLRLSPVA